MNPNNYYLDFFEAYGDMPGNTLRQEDAAAALELFDRCDYQRIIDNAEMTDEMIESVARLRQDIENIAQGEFGPYYEHPVEECSEDCD